MKRQQGGLKEASDRFDIGHRLSHHAASKLLQELSVAAQAMQQSTSANSAKALHDARRSIRRSKVYVLLASFTRARQKHLLEELGRYADATSDARDLDIRIKKLAKIEPHRETELRTLLNQKREQAYKKLLPVSTHLSAFADSSAELIATATPESETVEYGYKKLRKELRRSEKDIKAKLKAVSGRKDIQRLHKLRLAAKHLRYFREAAWNPQQFGKKRTKTLRKMQLILGNLHDVQTFREDIKGEDSLKPPKKILRALRAEEKKYFKQFRKLVSKSNFKKKLRAATTLES